MKSYEKSILNYPSVHSDVSTANHRLASGGLRIYAIIFFMCGQKGEL